MDWVRSCHTTWMFLWGKDQPPVKVRWFFTRRGARFFPHPSHFRNVDWDTNRVEGITNPYLLARGSWANGDDSVRYPGTNFHGPAAAFQSGGVVGVTPELTTDNQGALPECRGRAANGGLKMGGAMLFKLRLAPVVTAGLRMGGGMDFVKRYMPEADGGIKAGGEMPLKKCYQPEMEGGIKAGGECPVTFPTLPDVSGGIKVGGMMEFRFRFRMEMDGGIKAGGFNDSTRRRNSGMQGGFKAGGVGSFSPGLSVVMDGGIVAGGVGSFSPRMSLVMDGGIVAGGELSEPIPPPPPAHGTVMLVSISDGSSWNLTWDSAGSAYANGLICGGLNWFETLLTYLGSDPYWQLEFDAVIGGLGTLLPLTGFTTNSLTFTIQGPTALCLDSGDTVTISW